MRVWDGQAWTEATAEMISNLLMDNPESSWKIIPKVWDGTTWVPQASAPSSVQDFATDPGVTILGTGTSTFDWRPDELNVRARWVRNAHDIAAYFPLATHLTLVEQAFTVSFDFRLNTGGLGIYTPSVATFGVSTAAPLVNTGNPLPAPFIGFLLDGDADNPGTPYLKCQIATTDGATALGEQVTITPGTDYALSITHTPGAGAVLSLDGTAVSTAASTGDMSGIYRYASIPSAYVGGGHVSTAYLDTRIDNLRVQGA